MHLIEGIVEIIAKVMSLLMIIVIVVAVFDLMRVLSLNVFFETVVFRPVALTVIVLYFSKHYFKFMVYF